MSLAILISGGLDSAILLGDALTREKGRPGAVHPLFVRCGLAWETVEHAYLEVRDRPVPGPLDVVAFVA